MIMMCGEDVAGGRFTTLNLDQLLVVPTTLAVAEEPPFTSYTIKGDQNFLLA
jgi:hypothetical protein